MNQPVSVPVSVLDLASIVRDGTPGEAFERTVAHAREADRLGFNRFWLAEHHNLDGIASAATAVLIGHVAGQTQRIRVGSGGVMLPNHAPLIIAEQFGTLETLYPGRIDLGLGRAPGTDPATARAVRGAGASLEPDFAELLAELRGYLAPTREGQKVRAIPGQGLDIPIWLLGSSDYSARLAGQLGLPFAFASHFAPRHLLDALALYRDVFQPSAALDHPHAMVAVNTVVADTDDEAQRLATSLRQRFLRMIRNQRGQMDPPVATMDGLWSAQEQAMVESTLSVSAFGAPATVRERLDTIIQATGADELMITNDVHDPEARLHSLRLLAECYGMGTATTAETTSAGAF